MRKLRKKKQEKVFTIIGIVVSTILVLITMLFLYKILKINILPTKYLIPAIIGITLVDAGIIFVLIKKSVNIILKIIAIVFVAIIAVFDIIAYKYMDRSTKFIDNLVTQGIKTEEYLVVVNKDSEINKIEDLNDKKVSYVRTVGNSHDAMEKLKESVSIVSSNVTDIGELISGVLNRSLDSILISESIFNMYKEEDETLEEKTKVIYTVTLIMKEEQIAKEVDVTKDTFVLYISGMDTYGSITTTALSDVNIVSVINPKTHQILMISIPRDYYVKLHGIETDMRDKLTHAGLYGIETSVGTIEDLLDIDINYYVKVNFTSVVDIVNALGGIEVESKYAFKINGYSFKKGINRLNGAAALQFCRERMSFSGGDRVRGQNQEAVISAIIKKAASPDILNKYDSILSAIENKFQTNVSADNISKLIKMQLNDMPSWGIKTISLDGYDSENYSYSYPKSAGYPINYVMEPNLDTIKRAQELIKDIKGNLELDLTDENKTYKTYDYSNSSSSSTKSSSSKSTSTSSDSSSSVPSNSVDSSTTSKEEKNSDTESSAQSNSKDTSSSTTSKEEKSSNTESSTQDSSKDTSSSSGDLGSE